MSRDQDKADRLAAALRENLKRRKAQQRGQSGVAGKAVDTGEIGARGIGGGDSPSPPPSDAG